MEVASSAVDGGVLRERGDRRRGRVVLVAGLLLLVVVMLATPGARRVLVWPAHVPAQYSLGYLPSVATWSRVGSPLAAPSRVRTTATMDASPGFSTAQKQNNQRYLDIDTVYSGAGLKDLRVLLTS